MTAADQGNDPEGLESIQSIRVPWEIVNDVHAFLRQSGRRGHEGVGFWVGEPVGTQFEVRAAYIPKQHAGGLDGGCLVLIEGDELFAMNVWLHSHRMTIIAQLHSHPAAAYHSDTDEDFPVMTREGGLSIVIPDYAASEFSLGAAVVYRMRQDAQWQKLSALEAATLIDITEE